MNLRYGKADENVLKRSVADVILHERQKIAAYDELKKNTGCGPAPGGPDRTGGLFSESPDRNSSVSAVTSLKSPDRNSSVSAVTSLKNPDRNSAESVVMSARNPYRNFAISAVTFSEKNAGGLSVIRAVNKLAAEKIRACTFFPVILLPPGTQEDVLREIMKQICSTAFSLNVEVGQAHIEVTDAVTRPVITGSAAGISFDRLMKKEGSGQTANSVSSGQIAADPQAADQNIGRESAGEPDCKNYKDCKNNKENNKDKNKDKNKDNKAYKDIVAIGWIGLEGTLILTSDCREELEKRFSASLLSRMDMPLKELSVMRAAEIASAEGAGPMANLSDGGFMAGLWELSKKTSGGLDTDLKKVPLLQETIEITEYFGINPYIMASEGCLLAAAADGDRLAECLMENGIFAVRIGSLNGTKDKIIRNGEEIRHLDRPQTDSLAQYFFQHS